MEDRVIFVYENPCDVIVPFTIPFEELKGVICERIDPHIPKMISSILYRYPVLVFGGFVHFQTKYVTNEGSMQEIFSVYFESRSQVSFIELYIEFQQSEADRNIEWRDYNSDSEEEFESNYEVVQPNEDDDEVDDIMEIDVAEVTNSLANQQPFEEPSFMRALDLEAMHAPEYPENFNAKPLVVADGEFVVGMEFSSCKSVIVAVKDYAIRRGVDYRAPYLQKLIVNIGYSRTVREFQLRYGCLRERAGNIQVNCFDRQNEIFEVREMPSGCEFAVDIQQRHCDCGEFQVDRLPCRHVFACCANQRLDWQMYVHDVYKMDQVRKVYRAKFRTLGNPTTWPMYNGPRFIPNPFLKRVTKGRPKMTRFLNEMDTRMSRRPRHCKQCGAEGHSRSRCRQVGGSSAGDAAQNT
ncbi:hypothetical protein Ahy_B03g065253 [Arachis hypogaea]|uniref:SWIM-type domain-containing protein n=1 Tax=Arachis hypogaea TaxID=3818 RepID=A0A445A1A0_ARAHY|nr:hypothetical protein Ahy_B03g065253 [Arachis hypogaea]